MTDTSSRFVGSIPQHYDRHLGPVIFASFARDLSGRVARLSPQAILELATGTGILTRSLRDALPQEHALVASDLNPPMLVVAESKFENDENVRFEPADATDLPFDDKSFDVVACQFGVMFFPDKARSYREVLRVLRPGGHYLFNVWGSWQANAFGRIAHDTVASFFPDDPPGFYRVPFGYHDAAVIESELSHAGFSGVAIEPLQITSEIPSVTDFATGLVFGNPLFEEINARGGDPQEVCAAIGAAVQADIGNSLSLHALVISAGKD